MDAAVENLIIGAGPAGLGLGACLRRKKISFTIVERGANVGTSWRNHYARLHLHTAKSHSQLPYLGFPKHHPTFPAREQVVEYLETYAQNFELEPRFGVQIDSLRRRDDAWIATAGDAEITASRVILATGLNRKPVRPTFPGEDSFPGRIEHSADYRTAEPFGGQRVLVVGAGNTGGEIALDLCEHGCAVSMCIRSPLHVIPREFLGSPSQVNGVRLRWAPLWLRNKLAMWASKSKYADLESLGIRRPDHGIISQIIHQRKVPLIDIGTIERIREGDITVYPAITSFDGSTVTFVDGRSAKFDSVVLATGYRSGLEDWIEGGDQIVDDQGYPMQTAGQTALPGLYTIGFTNAATGWLREIGIEAPRLAAVLANAAAGQRDAV